MVAVQMYNIYIHVHEQSLHVHEQSLPEMPRKAKQQQQHNRKANHCKTTHPKQSFSKEKLGFLGWDFGYVYVYTSQMQLAYTAVKKATSPKQLSTLPGFLCTLYLHVHMYLMQQTEVVEFKVRHDSHVLLHQFGVSVSIVILLEENQLLYQTQVYICTTWRQVANEWLGTIEGLRTKVASLQITPSLILVYTTWFLSLSIYMYIFEQLIQVYMQVHLPGVYQWTFQQ